MAIPHPFKTRRYAGSPSAGGNVHTLAQHMASPHAHPQYVHKGDEIGGANIGDHELSSIAHRQYLLRRAELALTIAHFNATKNVSTDYYDAEHHTQLENAYTSVVTTALLNALLGSDANINNGPFSHILHLSRLVHTEDYMNSLTDSVRKTLVPSLQLIKTINDKITDFLTEERALTLFAAKDHDHTGVYAEAAHTHNLYDVFIQIGGTKIYPARADHNHDDLYWRKDEEITGDTDLSELSRVGIYPQAVTTGTELDTKIDLNVKNVQGYETFWINKDRVENSAQNFPQRFVDDFRDLEYLLNSEKSETFVRTYDKERVVGETYYTYNGTTYVPLADDAVFDSEQAAEGHTHYYVKQPNSLLGTQRSLVATATLSVVANRGTDAQLSSEDTNEYDGKDPTKHCLTQSVLQTLVTCASIPEFERTGSTDAEKALVKTLKNKLHAIYTRNGYAFETARWIETVLNIVFHESCMGFYGTGTEAPGDDSIAAVADLVNQRFDAIFKEYSTSGTVSDIPAEMIPGYIYVDGERFVGRKIRASKRMMLERLASISGIEYDELANMENTELIDVVNGLDASTVASTFAKYRINCTYAANPVQDKVVIHDLTSWMMGGAVTGSTFNFSDALTSSKLCNMFTSFESTDEFLPYVNYYAIDDRYIAVLDFVNPMDPSKFFTYVDGAASPYDVISSRETIESFYVDTDDESAPTDATFKIGNFADLSINRNREVDIDGEAHTLHGYYPIYQYGTEYVETADAAPVSGKKYFTKSGTTYTEFTGSAFAEGTTYYEIPAKYKYINGARYFVRLPEAGSSGLNQFYELIKGTNYTVGGKVGWSMNNDNVALTVTVNGTTIEIGPNNPVYMRVSIVEHHTEYNALTDAEKESGPQAGVQYYIYNGAEYEEADTSGGFNEDTTYYTASMVKGYLWSKKPVGTNTRYSSTIKYYSWDNAMQWNDITDEVEEDPDGYVMLQDNRTIFVDWKDVYQAAIEPELISGTPVVGTENVLQRGLFYQSFDDKWEEGKRYYQKVMVAGREVFQRYGNPPEGGVIPPKSLASYDYPMAYECVDVERMLDVWCAIRQLITTGAEQTVGSDTIVYNFGDNGSLISWDKWVKVITERDENFAALESVGGDLLKRLNTLDASTTLENIWNRSHTHANSEVLDKITGHKTNGAYDYPVFNNLRVAMYSDVTAVDTIAKVVDRTATKTMEIKGSATYDISSNNVDTRSGKYTLRISLRMTDPDKTITEIFKPTGSGFFTMLTLTPTTDRNYGVAGNVVLRSTPTGFTLYLGQSWSKNFTFDDFGRGLSLIISGSGSSTLRSVAISTASSRSSTIKTEVGQVDFGSVTQTINYVWLNNYLTCKIEKTYDYFSPNADDIGVIAEAAAKDYVPSKWMLAPEVEESVGDIERIYTANIATDVMVTDWALQNDEYECVLNNLFPAVTNFGEVRADLVLDVTTNVKHEIEHNPLVQKGSAFIPVRIREVPDPSNPSLKILKVFDLQSLCTTVVDGTPTKISDVSDTTTMVSLKLRVYFRVTA